jgi:hypothetical protein
MAPLDLSAPAWKVRRQAASKIQGLVRAKKGGNLLLLIARRVYEIGYDAESEEYFYYNKMTGDSHWDTPLILKACPPYRSDKTAISCATTMQAILRAALARKEVTKLMREVYRKDFDPDSGDYYYTNTRTNEVRWDNPAEALSLIKAEDAAPELGPDSQLIVEKDVQIEQLKKEVEEAKREAFEAKTSTHAKLDKDIRLERMANALRGQKRSRHFDEWGNAHIVAWFLEMDLEESVARCLLPTVASTHLICTQVRAGRLGVQGRRVATLKYGRGRLPGAGHHETAPPAQDRHRPQEI